jgi:hypothetical protein
VLCSESGGECSGSGARLTLENHMRPGQMWFIMSFNEIQHFGRL